MVCAAFRQDAPASLADKAKFNRKLNGKWIENNWTEFELKISHANNNHDNTIIINTHIPLWMNSQTAKWLDCSIELIELLFHLTLSTSVYSILICDWSENRNEDWFYRRATRRSRMEAGRRLNFRWHWGPNPKSSEVGRHEGQPRLSTGYRPSLLSPPSWGVQHFWGISGHASKSQNFLNDYRTWWISNYWIVFIEVIIGS